MKSLRSNVGAQARIYIRPIQISLSTKPVVEDEPSEIEEIGKVCGANVLVQNLQTHSMFCVEAFINGSESDDETLCPVNSMVMDASSIGRIENGDSVAPVPSTVMDVSLIGQDENHDKMAPVHNPADFELNVDELVEAVSKHCIVNEILDPVKILQYFQRQFVRGRELEVTDITQVCEGLTNYILVDRANILKTSLNEIKEITNLRPTLQVEFYGEVFYSYILFF